MTDRVDMTGQRANLSGCGYGEKGGRTRTRVLDLVRCPPPTGTELDHDWQAQHPREVRT